MKQNKATLPLIIFLSIAFGFVIGRLVYKSDNIFYSQNKDYQNLRALIDIVEDNYADQLNVFDFLKDALMIKLRTIDPYISFYEADEYNNVLNDINGEYEGVGIRYFMHNDTILISDVFPNSPADKAGLKKLDRIISFNNKNIVGLSVDSVSMLFSKDDTPTISTIDFLDNNTSSVQLEKRAIQINPIKYFYYGNNTAYIKIDAFHSNTYNFFMVATKDLLSSHKINNIILDLRDNPGGLLSSAVDILDEFFEQGDTLTITETMDNEREFYISSSTGLLKKANVIILINGSTASASELVSLAMQDNDRALIIGTRSYGKGVFQQDMPVVKGNVIHITKGKYYGPTGRWIDSQSNKLFDFEYKKTTGGRFVAIQNGIVPDIYNYGNMNDFRYHLFDDYCLDFIFKYKKTFENINNEHELLDIATSIVDPDTTYLRFTKQTDSIFLNAIEIFETSSVNEEIFKNDTLHPFTFLME